MLFPLRVGRTPWSAADPLIGPSGWFSEGRLMRVFSNHGKKKHR